MSDLPTWARVLLYAAAAIAVVVILYAVVYYAVRAAIRSAAAEQRAAARRQEDLLRNISTSAEYVADVADAWAEAEAERRGITTADGKQESGEGKPAEVGAAAVVEASPSAPAENEPAGSDRGE